MRFLIAYGIYFIVMSVILLLAFAVFVWLEKKETMQEDILEVFLRDLRTEDYEEVS